MHEQTTTKRVNVISLSLKGYFEIEIVVFHTLYTHTTHTHTHAATHMQSGRRAKHTSAKRFAAVPTNTASSFAS